MGLLNAPRRAIWICSILSFSAFLAFFFFSYSSILPVQYLPPKAPPTHAQSLPSQAPPPPPAQPTSTNIASINCHKKPRPEAYGQTGHNNGTKNEDLALPRLMAELWKPIIHPITERVFVTDKGERFEVPADQMRWKEPLGRRVVLIDTDTRLSPTTENTMLNECPPDYPTLPGRTGGHLNHYIYAMIHGYDYRLVKAADYPDRHGTWVKPAIVKEALKTHDFVVSLDSDAVFTHLDLPLEWLMNLWDYRPETLIAMAYDLDWDQDYDPQGNLILNTGFAIAQNSKRTQEMFARWEDCPRSIPGCSKWNHKWAHEQMAFSYYIRYEFNREHDVKNIPCNQANGNEFSVEGKCECKGVFVSHNWKHKHKTPELLSRSIMTSLARRVHGQFQHDIKDLYVDSSKQTYPIKNQVI